MDGCVDVEVTGVGAMGAGSVGVRSRRVGVMWIGAMGVEASGVGSTVSVGRQVGDCAPLGRTAGPRTLDT